jgi:hypothetical protein
MRLEGWETQINSEPIMQIERTEANYAVSHRSQNSWELARANYRNTERGPILPLAEVLLRVKQKFKVSVDWLLTGVE